MEASSNKDGASQGDPKKAANGDSGAATHEEPAEEMKGESKPEDPKFKPTPDAYFGKQDIVYFKIEENEKWTCEKHNQSKIFYCVAHSTPFCPGCLREKHKDCFNKDEVYDEDNISKCLENRCKELKGIAEGNLAEVDRLKTQYAEVAAVAQKNKESHEHLYEIIKNKIEELTTGAMKKKSAADCDLITQGDSILTIIKSTVEEYTSLISEYGEVSNHIIDKRKDGGIKELIMAYQKLNTPNDALCNKTHIGIGKNIADLRTKLSEKAIVYKEAAVTRALETTFKNIHNEGTDSESEQGTSGFVFGTAPLSSLLCIYDLATFSVVRKELTYNDKVYRVPYGAGTVQVSNKIFFVGGTYDLVKCMPTCLEFSLFKDKFIERPDLNVERFEHSAIAIGDGILCVGGRNDKGYLQSCELFWTTTIQRKPNYLSHILGPQLLNSSKWVMGPSMNEAKAFPSLCVFEQSPNVIVYSFGGTQGEKILSRVEVLCLTDETPAWKIIGAMNYVDVRSMGAIQVRLADTEGILLFGGLKEGNVKVKETYFFNPAAEKSAMKCNLVRHEELDMKREEDYYNRSPMKARGLETIYVVCQSQLCMLDFSKEKLEWANIDTSVRKY